MLGIFANSWRRFVGLFVADAVEFDGTNDYLKTTSGLGASDNKFATYSFWFKFATAAGTDQIFSNDDGTVTNKYMYFQRDANERFQGQWLNAAGTITMTWVGAVNEVADTDWHHFILSVDMSDTGKRHIYIDGVDSSPAWGVYLNENLIHSRSNWWIGTFRGLLDANVLDGDMAEFYFTNEYIDLSVALNREKFIKNGKPVLLGGDGSTPTGTQPLIYFNGNAAAWNAGTNAGSGGNFTMTGAVTDSTNEPVLLPQGVRYDTPNYLATDTNNANSTENNTMLFSAWFYGKTPDATVFHQSNGSINVNELHAFQAFYDASGFAFRLWNGGTGIIWTQWSSSLLTSGQWNHILATLNNGVLDFYINDVAAGHTTGLNATNILHGGKTIVMPSPVNNAGAQPAEMAEYYYTNETLDITVEANRRKFISAVGTPADLGSDGSTPTGTQPMIYMTGNKTAWQSGANKGTVTGFATVGTVTNSTNHPVELP